MIRTSLATHWYQPLAGDPAAKPKNWKNKLITLDTPFKKRSDAFNTLIQKFAYAPLAIPSEDELSGLVYECMIHGELEALTALLEQERPQTLRITKLAQIDILLKAMPATSTINHLNLSELTLDRANTSLLFELMTRMPELETLHLSLCIVDFVTFFDPPSCPPLPKLKNLHVERTQNLYPLLCQILPRHATTLQELTLRDLQAGKSFEQYLRLLEKATRLTHLDLSRNELSSRDCKGLCEALNKKSTLIHLSLAGCWTKWFKGFDWSNLQELVGQRSLVSLDLSGNKIPRTMSSVLMAIASHPGLQRLNFNVLDAEAGFILDVLPLFLASAKALVYLQLPGDWPDGCFKDLDKAMEKNHVLRALSIPSLESRRRAEMSMSMSMQKFDSTYPNYLALMDCVERNWQKWERSYPFIEGGMRVFLASMARRDPNDPIPVGRVHYDIAGYAARIAIERSGRDAMAVTLLNKSSHEQGLAALEREKKLEKTQSGAS